MIQWIFRFLFAIKIIVFELLIYVFLTLRSFLCGCCLVRGYLHSFMVTFSLSFTILYIFRGWNIYI